MISKEHREQLTSRDRNPEEVHQHKVKPKVKCLRSGVRHAHHIVVEEAGSIVKRIAVKLTHRNDHLQRIAQRVASDNHRSHNQASWSPAHSRHGFHAEHERILREVPRIGKCVLLPHLANQGLLATQVRVVVGVVAFEEHVDRAGEDKPHYGEKLAAAESRLDGFREEVGAREEDSTGAEEHTQEGRDSPFIWRVVGDVGSERVVRVVDGELRCNFGRVGSRVLHHLSGHPGERLVLSPRLGILSDWQQASEIRLISLQDGKSGCEEKAASICFSMMTAQKAVPGDPGRR